MSAQYVTAGINNVAQAQPLQYMIAPAEAYGNDKVFNDHALRKPVNRKMFTFF